MPATLIVTLDLQCDFCQVVDMSYGEGDTVTGGTIEACYKRALEIGWTCFGRKYKCPKCNGHKDWTPSVEPCPTGI